MLPSDGGGGSISVVPSSLAAASKSVKTIASQVTECGSSGSLNACVTTGDPGVDAALSRFDMSWSTTVGELGTAGSGLATSLSSAASAYEFTDTCAVPAN